MTRKLGRPVSLGGLGGFALIGLESGSHGFDYRSRLRGWWVALSRRRLLGGLGLGPVAARLELR